MYENWSNASLDCHPRNAKGLKIPPEYATVELGKHNFNQHRELFNYEIYLVT